MNKKNQLYLEMISYYRDLPKQIQHFTKVYTFGHLIGELEGLTPEEMEILDVGTLTHDIGIRICDEKYGNHNGKLQEQEGPAIVREMLDSLGYSKKVVDRVCFLIGHHHTYDEIEGMDYQILVEADFLVNLYEEGSSKEEAASVLSKIFKTKAGSQICKEMFGL